MLHVYQVEQYIQQENERRQTIWRKRAYRQIIEEFDYEALIVCVSSGGASACTEDWDWGVDGTTGGDISPVVDTGTDWALLRGTWGIAMLALPESTHSLQYPDIRYLVIYKELEANATHDHPSVMGHLSWNKQDSELAKT
jgi:hypothetical protein